MAIPDLLRGCPLFYELFDGEIEKLVKYCTVHTVALGTKIVSDGQQGDEIFILLDGRASVQKTTSSGDLIRIQNLGTGDVFGEMVLVDEKTRSADIVADSTCYVLEIKYKNMFGLFDKEPKIFSILILNLSRLLAKRLKGANQFILKLQKENQT